MALNYQEAIRSLSYVTEHPAAVMEYVEKHRGPLIITQNDTAKAVLLDIETYQLFQNAFSLLHCVKLGERDEKAGKLRPAASVFADIDRNLL